MSKNRNILTPIVVFVYNRPIHTSKTLEALKNNYLSEKSNLYIFSDGPAKKEDKPAVNEVRKIIEKIKGFNNKEIVFRDQNFGLANNIISGVSDVINKFERVIVVEDDLVCSPYFLNYMNQLLAYFEQFENVFSITGFNYPQTALNIPLNYPYDVYFSPRPSSWGWGTWKNIWENVDWEVKDFMKFKKDKKQQKNFNKSGTDKTEMLFRQMRGKIDSWAIRWDYHHFKYSGLCVYPTNSYIQNIGLDGLGTHSNKTKKFFHKELNRKTKLKLPNEAKVNKNILKNFRKVFNMNKKLVIKRFINKMIDYRL